jgi:hypothetical protein
MKQLTLFLLLALFGCNSQLKSDQTTLSETTADFVLLDSIAASEAIIIDTTDGFFDLVRIVEMEIQMKKNYEGKSARSAVLEDYQAFLQTEVMNFTEEEEQKVRAVMDQAKAACDALNPAIFPKGVALVKIRTNHYGPSVYYTRENCIMVPENELRNFNPEAFLSVMLHEIFHVYSRFHPAEREALYGLIHYVPMEEVRIDDPLRSLMFFNPDGVSYHWGIDLEVAGTTHRAIPIISSKSPTFQPELPAFFAYLDFGMYSTTRDANGTWVVGESLGNAAIPALFEKVSQNTQYIIHPDELMADNFMYITYPFAEGEAPEFDEQGTALLEAIKEVLTP